MDERIEFFFDLSSPWTCLAFHNIQPIAQEAGTSIRWRPILVGGVFNAVNPSVYQGRQDPDGPKMRHMLKSLADWARYSGVEMNFPSEHHPVRSVLAMRCATVLESDQPALKRFAASAFRGYFSEKRNLDEAGELLAIADRAGMDGHALIEAAASATVKTRLRETTEELVDRGGFGSPTIFIDRDDMYFGNDELPIVRQGLGLI